MKRWHFITGLFLLSGLTGLVYETVWIRLFSISFGNTAQAMSTVLGVFLGGLALGAFAATRLRASGAIQSLQRYGLIEIAVGIYALAIPWLIRSTLPVLAALYQSGRGDPWEVAVLRAAMCSAILLPATVLMGATLPLLAEGARSSMPAQAGRWLSGLYTINLIGASAGALLAGFTLLPAFGFALTMQLACAANIGIGLLALLAAREAKDTLQSEQPSASPSDSTESLPSGPWMVAAFGSGLTCMLYEVAWGRTYGLLFGPTASTVTLVLAAFLLGFAGGGAVASRLRRNLLGWVCGAQFACVALLAWAFVGAGQSPQWIADWVRMHSADPGQIELMKVVLLSLTLLPLATATGLIFPLLMRISPGKEIPFARRIGGLVGINTAGCLAGSLVTGWMLIPLLGTQATLLLGGLINAALGLALLQRVRPDRWKIGTAAAFATLIIAAIFLPKWDMAEMTAGVYKYAPYYESTGVLERGQVEYLKEGIAGTVVVRKDGGATILAIDGKVDATDSGGDLLTEKLLAHIPLLLAPDARTVCLIGLASGVTAGSALTHPIQTLDVVEVSQDVVHASQYFNGVNRKPLADPRTSLLLNDGRNHLSLTSTAYDVIISEPSNPWIAGMNSLFTQDFFRIAKGRLRPGGIFAQWFHIYNMPTDDLQSLLRAFGEVFPSGILWRLNDGDILLTGFADQTRSLSAFAGSPAAQADLAGVGVSDPQLLWDMYVMRDADLTRFAGKVPANTDDNPLLEFHGQRDLHAQTDSRNADELSDFLKQVAAPAPLRQVRENMTAKQLLANARMFERAESYRSAFRSYHSALNLEAESMEALAGMDRCARIPTERQMVTLALGLPGRDSLQERTALALDKAHSGDLTRARFLFAENAEAHPRDASSRFNFGVFCLERKEFRQAIEQFDAALAIDPVNLPAHEAIAESYLQLRDYGNAAVWSRKILKLDPNHVVARQILAKLEQ